MGEDIKGTLSRWMDMLQGNGVEEKVMNGGLWMRDQTPSADKF